MSRNKIVYYVATSLDGYICGDDEDISMFVGEGNGVDQYLADLQGFETVIMGRKTYEFGYKFGLPAGQPAYPHMQHYIFSENLDFEQAHPQVHVVKERSIDRIKEIRDQSETDVYLCGGGVFAGWLLENNLIDQLKIKLNPIILGSGTPLFGDSKVAAKWELSETSLYDNGLQIMSYDLIR